MMHHQNNTTIIIHHYTSAFNYTRGFLLVISTSSD
jgi:hypothetical protein